MKFGVILLSTWAFIHLFKKLGMKQVACGLVSGLVSSVLVHGFLFALGVPGTSIVVSFVFVSTLAALVGFFISRRIYGLPGLFQDAQ